VLSLHVSDAGSYAEILIKAHEKMSLLAETVVGPLSRELAREAAGTIEGDNDGHQALTLARQLRASFEDFFDHPCDESLKAATAAAHSYHISPAGVKYAGGEESIAEPLVDAAAPIDRTSATVRLTLAVGQCRSSRLPLSVVLIAVQGSEPLTHSHRAALERAMQSALREEEAVTDVIPQPGGVRRLMVLAGRDRLEAVGVARSMIERLRRLIAPMHGAKLLPECQAAAGVAWVDLPAKNFQAVRLVETAQRCLTAALASGGVKSLEVS
jgi:hypothetical protein